MPVQLGNYEITKFGNVGALLGPSARPRHMRPFGDIPVVERIGDARVVLIFGGDGTVHRHLPDAVAAQAAVLVVPVGSGNDFAAALGLRTLQDSLRAWQQFTAGQQNLRTIDLGRIEPLRGGAVRYFCCIGGTGLDAETNRRANSLPAWLRGRGGYVLSALRAIAAYRYPRISVSTDEPPLALEGRATLAAFANAPAYGGGMRMAPRAQMDDGLFDVVYARHISKPRLVRFFPKVFSGTHLALDEVEYFQTRRLQLITNPPLAVYADGEYICNTPVEVAVVPRALTAIV